VQAFPTPTDHHGPAVFTIILPICCAGIVEAINSSKALKFFICNVAMNT
jgi:hypothetical protein